MKVFPTLKDIWQNHWVLCKIDVAKQINDINFWSLDKNTKMLLSTVYGRIQQDLIFFKNKFGWVLLPILHGKFDMPIHFSVKKMSSKPPI